MADTKFQAWEKLLRPPYADDQAAAVVAAKALFARERLPALDPLNADGRQITVLTAMPRAYRHVLFKAEGDTDGRIRPEAELPKDFQPKRAERIWFIPDVLLKPNRIHVHDDAKVRGAKMYFYNCDVAPDEIFAVLVRHDGGRFNFTTAYSMTEAEWLDKRRGKGTQHPPLRLVRNLSG